MEIVDKLLQKGAKVHILARNKVRLNEAVANLAAIYGPTNIEGHVLNITNMTEIRQFAAAFTKTETRLDVLVNNAGQLKIYYPKTIFADKCCMYFGDDH